MGILFMQTLYRQRRVSSARPGARGLERHLASEDLNEHLSRPFAAEVEGSLGVLEDAQAHRQEVWAGLVSLRAQSVFSF